MTDREPAFLAMGDVIDIKPGMTIHAIIPDRFIYSNRTQAPLTEQSQTNITVGEKRQVDDGHGKIQTFDSNDIVGRYLVTKTAMEGGSHGNINSNNDYPDGHHVFAQRMGAEGSLEKGAEISFYQSGCFNATIYPKDIQPVARMAQTVTWAPAPLDSGLGKKIASARSEPVEAPEPALSIIRPKM